VNISKHDENDFRTLLKELCEPVLAHANERYTKEFSTQFEIDCERPVGTLKQEIFLQRYNAALVEATRDTFCWMLDGNPGVRLNNPLSSALILGAQIGILMMLKQDVASNFHKTLAALTGRMSVIKDRWVHADAITQQFVEQAEKQWEAGSTFLHNEMADQLLNADKTAEHPSRVVLLDALKPVAKKYGKIRGMKGVCKKK